MPLPLHVETRAEVRVEAPTSQRLERVTREAVESRLGEPLSEVLLRDARGDVHSARIIEGPSKRGGRVFLAGLPRAWTHGSPPGTWPTSALPVPFVLSLPDARDLPNGAAVPELALALQAWARPSCSAFRAKAAPRAAATAADDGINVIVWHDDAWPAELLPGVLAQTVVHTDATGHVYDADIHVNGVDFRWSTTEENGRVDVRGILTHELGHALGLGHSADPIATMYATSNDGIAWRSLEKDDDDGACALYPGLGASDCSSGDSGTACPSGYACLARACVKRGERFDMCSPCTRIAGACRSAGDDARCVDRASGSSSASPGLVCGRACALDADCGAGFHCRATSTAGDLQCVADDGCTSGPAPCSGDADCATFGAVCKDGACVGIVDDAVHDAGASVDASDGGAPPSSLGASGGCALSARGEVDDSGLWVYVAVMGLGLFRRRSPRACSHADVRRRLFGARTFIAALFGVTTASCGDAMQQLHDPGPPLHPLSGDAACHAMIERIDSLAAHHEGPDPNLREKPGGPPRPDRVTFTFDVRLTNPTAEARWIVFPDHFPPDNQDVSPFGSAPVKKITATSLGGRGRLVLVDAQGDGGFHAVFLPPGGRVVIHHVAIRAAWSTTHATGRADFLLAKGISIDGDPIEKVVQGSLLSDAEAEGDVDSDPKDELSVTKIFGAGRPEGPVQIDEECRTVGQTILRDKEPE